MKRSTFIVLATLAAFAPALSHAAINSVHTTVILAAGKPSVTAAFELAQVSQPAVTCTFLTINGDATQEEQAAWRVSLANVQGITLTGKGLIQTYEGLRQDEVDARGRLRRSTWIFENGMIHQVALIDENGNVLQLDRWQNQLSIPDGMASPLVCGKNKTRSLAVRLLGGAIQSGQTELQVLALEEVADKTTSHSLVSDLGLASDACSPTGQKATTQAPAPANTPIVSTSGQAQAAGASPGSLRGKSTFSYDKPLIIAPNPASDKAQVFYNLDTEASAILNVVDLNGDVVAVYGLGDQVPGAHSMVFDVSKLASGLYVATLISGGGGGRKLIGQFKFAVRR